MIEGVLKKSGGFNRQLQSFIHSLDNVRAPLAAQDFFLSHIFRSCSPLFPQATSPPHRHLRLPKPLDQDIHQQRMCSYDVGHDHLSLSAVAHDPPYNLSNVASRPSVPSRLEEHQRHNHIPLLEGVM